MTIFYAATFERRFPVSYLLVERLASILGDQEPDSTALATAVSKALKDCQTCSKPTAEDIAYVVERLAVPVKAQDSGVEEQSLEGKSFGGGFLKWVKELDPEQTCMFVAGYDLERAATLYARADRDDVVALAAVKVNQEWELARVRFEAALFGFGGGYGKGDAGDSGKEATEDELKKLHETLKL